MSIAVDRLRGATVAARHERHHRARIFAPRPTITMSQWADSFAVLPRSSSAEPGRWRTDRAPYQRGMLDAVSDPRNERVAVMSSAQVGKSSILLVAIGYYVDQDPAPILLIQPSLEFARDFSRDRVKPTIQETPVLRAKVHESSGRRDSSDTMLRKEFPGGYLTLVGANSATGLASRPIRVVLFDEVDKFPASAGDKGDPISLAVTRTRTFWNRKIVLVSTPGIKGASRIEKEWAESDQRRYHVACPHCQHLQHLRWAQLDFDTASYCCESCGVLIAETDKPRLLAAGRWIAGRAEGTFPGFHLNALYSPWTTWRELIDKFITAKKAPDTLQVFVNEDLGELWDPQDGDGIDTDELTSRRETYAAEVPAAVGVLVAFVDVQREWLELLVKGYGATQESWAIAHHRIRGNTAHPEVWERLDPLLLKGYTHQSGATLTISMCGIDSGDGENVHPVYTFVAPRQKRARCPVWATKGSSVRGRPIIAGRPSKRNKYGVRVLPVGTDTAKDVIFPRLKLKRPSDGTNTPPGYMHFPHPTADGGFDDEYLAQFGREKAFTKYTHGVPFRSYEVVPKGGRNEAVDLEVGCLHMLHLLGAGVYDQLGAWAARIAREAANDPNRVAVVEDASPEVVTTDAPAITPAPRVMQPQRPSAPPRRGGGYLNSWRR